MLIVDPQTYEMTIDEGDQEKVQFTILNSDGTPYNASGSAVSFIAKRTLDDGLGAAVINVNSAIQITQWDMTQAAVGIVVLEFSVANTDGHGGQRLNYALKIVDGVAKTHTPRVGIFNVRKNAGH